MKAAYIISYLLSGIIFLTAVLGSNLTKPLFESASEKTLETAGFKKSYFQTIDEKIDDLIYKSKQVEYQIERLKSLFSSDKVDESKYQKEQSRMVERTLYSPLIGMFNFIYRIIFGFISIIFLSFAIVFHIGYRSFDLRKRVKILESIVFANKA